MRKWRSTRLRRSWIVVVGTLALTGPALAGSGGERHAVGNLDGATEIGRHPSLDGNFIAQQPVTERLRSLLEVLAGRIAKLEARMDARADVVTPPAPQIRCAGSEGCWVDWMGR